MRFRLLPMVCKVRMKGFNPSKIQGNDSTSSKSPPGLVASTLSRCSFWSQSSWWLCLSSQLCAEALFYGPHRKLSSCISKVTLSIYAGWGLSSALSWLFGRWHWAEVRHLNSTKHSTKQSSHCCLCSKPQKKNADGVNPCLEFWNTVEIVISKHL